MNLKNWISKWLKLWKHQRAAHWKRKTKISSSLKILLITIFALILLSWILNWANVKDIKIIGLLDSFHIILSTFETRATLIIFLLIIGAFIKIVFETQALEAGIGKLIEKLDGKEIILIPIIMALFAIGGTTFGMAEETIPFYLILLPVFISAGFDAMTGFLVVLLGAGIGVWASILNPFKISIAVEAINDSVKETIINQSSGIVFRIIGFFAVLIFAISFVTLYAAKVKKDATKSQVYDLKEEWAKFSIKDIPPLTKKRKITIVIFIITFLILIFSLLAWKSFGVTFFSTLQTKLLKNFPYLQTQFAEIGDFGFIEMAIIFLVASLLIYRINRNELRDAYLPLFFAGLSQMIGVAAIIVIASSLQGLMQHSQLDKSFISGLNYLLVGVNRYLFIFITFLVFTIISFFIPSSIAFAGAIFPIFAPTTAAMQLSSGTVTAFSYSSGLVNLVSPTSGIFSAALAVSKMPYDRYLKVIWPFFLGLIFLSLSLLLIGTLVANGKVTSLF